MTLPSINGQPFQGFTEAEVLLQPDLDLKAILDGSRGDEENAKALGKGQPLSQDALEEITEDERKWKQSHLSK